MSNRSVRLAYPFILFVLATSLLVFGLAGTPSAKATTCTDPPTNLSAPSISGT